jgi:hypothetical protein
LFLINSKCYQIAQEKYYFKFILKTPGKLDSKNTRGSHSNSKQHYRTTLTDPEDNARKPTES